MKKYIQCASQITADKQEYIFNFIAQGDPKFDSKKEELIPKIRFRVANDDPACSTLYLYLPEELTDYLKWHKAFHERNQAALQDFARMLYRWSGASTPAIHIWVDMNTGSNFYYINSLDMVLVRIDHDGYDRSGYWTKYLITARNTNEFTIGYQVSYMRYSDRTGYVKKNGTTIMRESIPSDADSRDNAYIALGIGSTYEYGCVVDFLAANSCFKY